MLLIKSENYIRMNWKNGGGKTAEILKFPSQAEPYFWRISQATVQKDGSFSIFPGMDRILFVFKGQGLRLNEKEVRFHESISFSGEEDIFAKIIGSEDVEDVNLIYDRKHFKASMRLASEPINTQDTQGMTLLYFCLQGKLRWNSLVANVGDILYSDDKDKFSEIEFVDNALAVYVEIYARE